MGIWFLVQNLVHDVLALGWFDANNMLTMHCTKHLWPMSVRTSRVTTWAKHETKRWAWKVLRMQQSIRHISHCFTTWPWLYNKLSVYICIYKETVYVAKITSLGSLLFFCVNHSQTAYSCEICQYNSWISISDKRSFCKIRISPKPGTWLFKCSFRHERSAVEISAKFQSDWKLQNI